VLSMVEGYNVQHSFPVVGSRGHKAQRRYSNMLQLLDSVQVLCQR
jgi:hypothetical protein